MLSVMLNEHVIHSEDYILQYYNDKEFPYVSGLDIEAKEVYSICPGKVISATNDGAFKHAVTVLVNSNQIVRYTNLQSVNVREGSVISIKTLIGHADKFVRFEYCTASPGDSKWPVRIKSVTMYKQDPLGLLTGRIKLNTVIDDIKRASGNEPMIPLDKHVLNEFSGSRGDDNE